MLRSAAMIGTWTGRRRRSQGAHRPAPALHGTTPWSAGSARPLQVGRLPDEHLARPTDLYERATVVPARMESVNPKEDRQGHESVPAAPPEGRQWVRTCPAQDCNQVGIRSRPSG